MRKRVFAMVLVAALCVSLLPTTAFAEEGEYTAEATEETAETDTQTADIEIAEEDSAIIVAPDVEEETESDSDNVEEPEAVAPEESEDVEEAAEEEAEPEETVYTEKDGSIRVEVTAPADALPEGAELSVQRYEKNSQEYRDAAEAIGFEEDQGTDMAAVDISFLLDGEEVEPSKPVKVSIDVSDILPEDTDASTLEVQHLVEKADDTVKPVVVANDSEETEGSIDEKKAIAEFEIDSFSTFTVTWPYSTNSKTSLYMTVYLDNVDISYEIDNITFTSEDHELNLENFLSENNYGTGDYTFLYATASGTRSGQGGGSTTLGDETNPVVSISKTAGPNSTFEVTTLDGTTTTMSNSNLTITAYYQTPQFSVDISALGADAEEDWLLQANLSHTGSYDHAEYLWTVTSVDENGNDTGLTSTAATATDYGGGRAFIIWSDDVQDDHLVMVHVTVYLYDENGEVIGIATASYELEYSDETIDIDVTYGPNQTSVGAGVTVTIVNTADAQQYTYNGTTDATGRVEFTGVHPGVYTVSTSGYTDDSGNTYACASNETLNLHENGNYDLNLKYQISNEAKTCIPDKTDWNHVDIKLTLGSSSTADANSVTSFDIISVKIIREDGITRYTSGYIEKENDVEFQIYFNEGDDDSGTGSSHTISFSSTDTIVIVYTETWTDSYGNVQEDTYEIEITPSSVYPEGTTYPADGARAYKLYNYLYNTSYTSNAELMAAGVTSIDVSGLGMMTVAAILCDSSTVNSAGDMNGTEGMWGMDFALSLEAMASLGTNWAFEIEKTLENVSMDAGVFGFFLYDATVLGDVWTIEDTVGDYEQGFTNAGQGKDLDGNSRDTMQSSTIVYTDDEIRSGEFIYYILYEYKGGTTGDYHNGMLSYDGTVYGVRLGFTVDKEGEIDLKATYYLLTSNGSDGYIVSSEIENIDTNSSGYPIFSFTNVYSTDVNIIKTDMDGNELTAKFTLTQIVTDPETGEPRQCYYDPDNANGPWIDYSDDGEIRSFDLGSIDLETPYDGDYTLTEIEAPSGYNTIPGAITFIIEDGQIVESTVEWADTSIDANIKDYVILNNGLSLTVKDPDITNPIKGVDTDGDGKYDNDGFTVWVGQTVEYEISYYNPESDKVSVIFTDVLDDGLEYVSSEPAAFYSEEDRTIIWQAIEVGSGETVSVTFKAMITEDALIKNEVDNTAEMQYGDDQEAKVSTNTVENPVPDNPSKGVDTNEDSEYDNNGDGVQVGQIVEYQISYYNPDEDTVSVIFTDELNGGLEFVSATEGGEYDNVTHIITWPAIEVESGETVSVTFKAMITEDALIKNEVDNTAEMQYGDDPEATVNTNTVYNPVPDKDVDANGDEVYEDSGMQVNVGDTLVYKIDYENPDDDVATVTITDEVNVGLDFVSATDGGSYDESTRTITWVISDVAAHTNGSVYFTATVNESAVEAGVVENTATVQVGSHAEQQTKTVYNPIPGKDVDADGDDEYGDNGESVQVGDTLTYEISYFNGYDEAATITITDILDRGVDYIYGTADPDAIFDGNNTLTWIIEDVEPHTGGTVTFQVTVNEQALEENVVENTASVQIGDDPAVDTNTTYNPIPDKDVDADGDEVFEDNGMHVSVGDTLVYKIDYENPDDEAATVTITDELDIGLDFVSATDGGSYDESTRMITWVIEGVEPHTNGSVYFTATVNEDALVEHEVDNTATVQVGNHAEQQTKTVYNPLYPDKVVDVDGDGEYDDAGMHVEVGDTLTYVIEYSNSGDEAATIIITDVLDLGVDYIYGSADPDAIFDGNRTLTWIIEDVPAHTNGSVTFQVTVNEKALEKHTVENTATVQVGDGPAVDTNTTDNPLLPDKDVEIHENDTTFGDSGLGVQVGDTLTYVIEYRNSNDDAATVTITDELDEGLDFVSASDDGTYDESTRTITWVIKDVEAHTDGSVTFKVTVNETALIRNEIDNTATVQVGDHPAVDTNTVYNPIPYKDVEIHEDDETFGDSGLAVRVGDTLTYKIDYENPDDEPATITITDVLDLGVTYIYGTADPDVIFDGNRTLTWIIEEVPAHTNGSVTFQVTVNESALEMNLVENTAIVQVGDHPEQETNKVENPLGPEKDVEIHENDTTFGDNGLAVQVGDTLTYKIDYFNGNNEPATVTITDVLDEGLTYESSEPEAVVSTNEEGKTVLTWTIKDAEPHKDGSVTFTATVNENALVKNEVENTATVQVGDDPDTAVETNPVYNPVKYREYYPIDEEIVTDEDDIFDLDAWVKDESVNEYNAIEIEMTTLLPKISGEDVANGEFTMNFHEVLDHELVLDADTADFSVFLYGNTDEPFEVPTNYYKVTINPEGTCTIPGENGEPGQEVQCSFHVDVDLTALYNDGLISDEDLQGDTWISIFFFADLEGTDLNGSYTSTVWYDVYDGENWEYTSNVDVVSVYTYEVEILKYDVEDEDQVLAGAIFEIYYDEDCTKPVYRYVGQGFDEKAKEILTATSNDGGVAMFYGLAEGTYYVKEVAAPLGYVLSDEVIPVEVGADTTDENHVYHTTFANTPAEPDEPENPRKYVETNGDGDFNDNHLMVNVGDEVTYRIYYYNHYDEPVTVTVKDTLDYALDFVSATSGGVYDEETRTITWTIENAAAYTADYVEFTATVNDVALLEDEIENTASVQIGNDDFVDTNTVANPTPDAEGEGNPTTGNPTSGTGAPKTGDTNNFGLWLALMMAAMVGVFAALRMRKRS